MALDVLQPAAASAICSYSSQFLGIRTIQNKRDQDQIINLIKQNSHVHLVT